MSIYYRMLPEETKIEEFMGIDDLDVEVHRATVNKMAALFFMAKTIDS